MKILLLLSLFNIAFAQDISSCFSLFKVQTTKKVISNIEFPYNFGKAVRFKPKKDLRLFEQMEDIKLGSFNLENFASTSKKLSSQQIAKKSESIMKAISKSELDIVVVQEVLEPQYLEEMIKAHLNNEYRLLYIENSRVSDNIAFLVKRDMPFNFKLNSMKDYKRGSRIVFNKDFPILEVKSSEGQFLIGGVHLKSKYGGNTSNNFYANVRSEQASSILQIKEKLAHTYGESTPFIVAGDFNSTLNQTSKEFDQLRAHMDDAFDLSIKKPDSRITNIAYDQNGQRVSGQIDGILINKSSKQVVIKETKVFKFESQNGEILDMADPSLNRSKLPSDHGLLMTTIDLRSLL